MPHECSFPAPCYRTFGAEFTREHDRVFRYTEYSVLYNRHEDDSGFAVLREES